MLRSLTGRHEISISCLRAGKRHDSCRKLPKTRRRAENEVSCVLPSGTEGGPETEKARSVPLRTEETGPRRRYGMRRSGSGDEQKEHVLIAAGLHEEAFLHVQGGILFQCGGRRGVGVKKQEFLIGHVAEGGDSCGVATDFPFLGGAEVVEGVAGQSLDARQRAQLFQRAGGRRFLNHGSGGAHATGGQNHQQQSENHPYYRDRRAMAAGEPVPSALFAGLSAGSGTPGIPFSIRKRLS